MDLLQKFTLYDLLGYTVPGCILIWVCGESGIKWFSWVKDTGEAGTWTIFMLLCLGYILGIVMAEFMEWILRKTGGLKISLEAFEKYNVNDNRIRQALQNAGMIDEKEQGSGFALFIKYKGEMYSRIQAQDKYQRIHNYASSELLCKNMIFVSFIFLLNSVFKVDISGIILGIIIFLCFLTRRKNFQEKKMGYCLGWFLNEYNKADNGLGQS